MVRCLSKILLSGIVAVALTSGTFAEDAVKLRFGTHNAATEPGVLQGANVFMKEAEKDSKGAVSFDFYPAQQAGKALQMFDLVRTGAVDIGYISTGYTSGDKLPLIATWEIPGLAKSSCDVVKAMNVLGSPGGLIYEKSFKPSGLRMLAYQPYPPYMPSASRVPITKLEDLKGLKMRSTGGLMDLTVQKVGGIPVKMTAPEIYQALQRGTIDTVLLSYISVKGLGLGPVAKYGTTGFSFGTPGDLIAISEARFNSLTKQQQDALVAAGKATSEHWCHYVDENNSKMRQELIAGGESMHTWSPEDIAKLQKLTADVPGQWAKKLDDRGLPGTEVLAQFRKLVGQ